MRCQHIQPHLLALIEGELTQKKHAKVSRHVAACPACASDMRKLRQTLRVVRTIGVPEPSPAFWQEFGAALHQRIHGDEAAHQRRRHWQILEIFRLPKPALAAVAVSLILAGSLPFLSGHPGQQRLPKMVVAGGDEMSLATNLDFLKHLDLLEEVDVLEQLYPSP